MGIFDFFNVNKKQNFANDQDSIYERNQADVFSYGIAKYTNQLLNGFIPNKNQYIKIDQKSFKQYSPKKLLEILKNNHPDISQAIWNFKIIGGCDYQVKAYLLDGETEHKSAQKVIDQFLMDIYYSQGQGFEKSRSLDKLVFQMFDQILLTGSTALEIVMDSNFEKVMYLTTVDTNTINYRFEDGRIIPYQFGNKGTVDLDIPTFFIEGLDETDTNPYGVSPFLSSIQTISFQLQVLEDLRQIIHNQGYGKYDIKIIEEVLLKRMPNNIKNNDKKKQDWLTEQLQAIISMYSKLEPDAAFVHFDSVNVDMVENAKAMVDPQKIMAVIDTQIMGALKQYSTLMGRRSQGQTEQYAKLEIRLFMQSIHLMQETIENILSRAFTKIINLYGYQGYVEFEFEDTEIRTELEKVNFEQIAILNAERKRANGWITQDDASEEITGSKAVGAPDKEMLGVKQVQGALDERQPNDPQSSDSTNPNK